MIRPTHDGDTVKTARNPTEADRAAPLPRVEKPATVRCLGPVDANALAAQVGRLAERAWWREDGVKPNRFSCFHHTRHIVFRFIEGNRDPRRFYSLPGWRIWRQWLLPLMDRVATIHDLVEPVFPKAMLARLESGHGIDSHVDGGASNPLVHKIHIPLRTDPEAVLTVAGTTVHLAAGYAWEVNNLAYHGAFNGGARDRIHFIFEMFDGAGGRAAEVSPDPGAAARRLPV